MIHYPYGPKSEWRSQAELIVRGLVPDANQDIPMLLEWMRDMNWPGADLIAAHVRGLDLKTLEPVRRVLVSNDSLWIYWVLHELGDAFRSDYWDKLRSELMKIAISVDADGAHLESIYILAKNKLEPLDVLRELADKAKIYSGLSGEDYEKIYDVLNQSMM